MVVGSPIVLNLIPGGVMPVMMINETDKGYKKEFLIYNGAAPYNLPANVSATIRGTKRDGYGVTEAAEVTSGSNLVRITVTEQMTAVPGPNIFELVFEDTNNLKVATINFIMMVERSALNANTVISDSDIAYAGQVLDRLQSVAAFKEQLDNASADITELENVKIQRFDTVAQMKADTALKAGMYAQTGGYYAVNDGGGALYRIYNTVPSTHYETLANGLYAKLIDSGQISPEMFGAYGDGTHNDTAAINNALEFGSVTFGHGKTYLVTADADGAAVIIPSGRVVNLNESTIRLAKTTLDSYQVILIKNVHDVSVKNGTIIGDKNLYSGSGSWEYGHCVYVGSASNIHISDVSESYARGDGIYIGVSNNTECDGVYLDDCVFDHNNRNGMTVAACKKCFITDCTFNNSSGVAPQAGFDIEPNGNNPIDVMMDGIVCSNNVLGFSISNFESTNYLVQIGNIRTNGINVDLRAKSKVIIDSMFINDANANPMQFHIGSEAVCNIESLEIYTDGQITNVISANGEIDGLTIGVFKLIAAAITSFVSNNTNMRINIGTLYFDTDMEPRTIVNVNLYIEKLIKAVRTITQSMTLKEFDNDIVFINTAASLLTANVPSANYYDGAIIKACNQSAAGAVNSRFATGDGSQTIVNGDTASNTVQIPPGKSLIMQYNKKMNRWYVLFLA